jgi:hypothetical protein
VYERCGGGVSRPTSDRSRDPAYRSAESYPAHPQISDGGISLRVKLDPRIADLYMHRLGMPGM